MKPSHLRTATVRYVGQIDEEGAEHMLLLGLHMDDAEHVTWEEGEKECNTFQEGGVTGHLVSIHSAAEQSFVYELFKSLTAAPTTTRNPWFPQLNIGLRVEQGKSLSWSDGSPVDYTNWYSGEPNGWNAYGQISDGTGKNGLWYDNDNAYLRPFMCKIPRPSYELTYN
ncbi:Lectin 1 [Holothuria leucospilota]|uniref:Lectin 1 n=1 Tax=Holothuria leucospilota TaxID=206669 RepID=A0A9Q1CGE5_HOLLE|nr:Lectin 1 [Holothuria leucospilota]